MFEATGLFAKECLRLYSQNWSVLRRTEDYYCGTSPQFMVLEAGQVQEYEGLVPPVTDTDTLVTKGGSRRVSSVTEQPPLYEIDIADAEEQQQQQQVGGVA